MGDREDRGRVFIQLSENQVNQVIGTMASAESPAVVFDELTRDPQAKHAGRPTQWLFRTLMEDRSLSHSLLIGLEVLTCFPLDGTERGVADVAKQLRMNNSTVHRYMSTLMRVGLLEQNLFSRLYRLGNRRAEGDAG